LSEANLVWARIRDASGSDYWERIENKLMKGFPDSCYAFLDGRTGFVEFKFKEAWPKRPDTIIDLGLEKEQIAQLQKMWRKGCRVYLLARVGEEFLLVRGCDVGKHTQQWWRDVAIYCGKFDYETIRRKL
jgi:hypothetical protein